MTILKNILENQPLPEDEKQIEIVRHLCVLKKPVDVTTSGLDLLDEFRIPQWKIDNDMIAVIRDGHVVLNCDVLPK
jgi:hypothetical protein